MYMILIKRDNGRWDGVTGKHGLCLFDTATMAEGYAERNIKDDDVDHVLILYIGE